MMQDKKKVKKSPKNSKMIIWYSFLGLASYNNIDYRYESHFTYFFTSWS
jgi:hypothetical protein